MKKILIFTLTSLILFGCGKSNSTSTTPTSNTFITVTIDGKEYKFTGKKFINGTNTAGCGIMFSKSSVSPNANYYLNGYDGTQYFNFITRYYGAGTLPVGTYTDNSFNDIQLTGITLAYPGLGATMTISKIENNLYSGTITGSIKQTIGGAVKTSVVTAVFNDVAIYQE